MKNLKPHLTEIKYFMKFKRYEKNLYKINIGFSKFYK